MFWLLQGTVSEVVHVLKVVTRSAEFIRSWLSVLVFKEFLTCIVVGFPCVHIGKWSLVLAIVAVALI